MFSFVPPSPELMAQRRPEIQDALERVRTGNLTPRPTLPPLFYSYPKPAPKPLKPPRALCKGDLPTGTVVPTGKHLGTVLGFLPAGQDPAVYIPANHPVTMLGGHHRHHSAPVARYCVAVQTEKGLCYHLPKATTVERDWRKLLAESQPMEPSTDAA